MAIRKKLIKDNGGELPILAEYELLDKIEELEKLRDRALVSFLYLTGCRISEVVPYIIEVDRKKKKYNRETKEYYYAPIEERKQKGTGIQKKQIEIDEDFMKVYHVRSLKRKAYVPRTIPIHIKREQKFFDIFKNYFDTLEKEDILFNITRQRAYQILSSIGLFNHYLRHLRLTKLSITYGFTSAEIKQFVNWKESYTADYYIHLSAQNLMDKMKK